MNQASEISEAFLLLSLNGVTLQTEFENVSLIFQNNTELYTLLM
jgi:hypothetical protein